jgi:hypothetical protein
VTAPHPTKPTGQAAEWRTSGVETAGDVTLWDNFHAHAYWKANYAFLRGDDRRFLERLRDFFGAEAAKLPSEVTGRFGIDVGSGANLYPALAMLPLCEKITLLEYGVKNCEWLGGEVSRYSPYWFPYWRKLWEHPVYQKIGKNARRRLAKTAVVERGSLFDLPLRGRKYHVGTMFFVAESITDQTDEFYQALEAFLGSLTPGAPFAAAFMRNSNGYVVDDQAFPALRIDEHDVFDYLKTVDPDVVVETVNPRGQFVNIQDRVDSVPTRSLRHGYDGMILALGHVK